MIKPLSRKDETSFKGSTSNYSHNRVTLSRGLVLPRFASCKGIQDSVWFRIPHHGFRIPDTGFRILCQWNLHSGLQSLVWFWIPWAVFRILNPRVPYSKTIFRIPDSGFQIPLHGVPRSCHMHPANLTTCQPDKQPGINAIDFLDNRILKRIFSVKISFCSTFIKIEAPVNFLLIMSRSNR